AIREAITAAIIEAHEVGPRLIALLDRGGLPKTSSGKLRRSATGDALVAGDLKARLIWRAGPAAYRVDASPPEDSLDRLAPADRTVRVRDRLTVWLSGRAQLPAAQIDPSVAFASYGIDSRGAVELAAALERWIERPVPTTIIYEKPTIDQ